MIYAGNVIDEIITNAAVSKFHHVRYDIVLSDCPLVRAIPKKQNKT